MSEKVEAMKIAENIYMNSPLDGMIEDFTAHAAPIIAEALSAQAKRIEELREALELCLPYVPISTWKWNEPKAKKVVGKMSSRKMDRVEPVARTKARAALAESGKEKPNDISKPL